MNHIHVSQKENLAVFTPTQSTQSSSAPFDFRQSKHDLPKTTVKLWVGTVCFTVCVDWVSL